MNQAAPTHIPLCSSSTLPLHTHPPTLTPSPLLQGGVGGYTDSRGNTMIRNEVADFIAARDGARPDPDAIFLTDGASTGVKMLLQALIRDERDAVLVPIPQYPLYSASCTLFGEGGGGGGGGGRGCCCTLLAAGMYMEGSESGFDNHRHPHTHLQQAVITI